MRISKCDVMSTKIDKFHSDESSLHKIKQIWTETMPLTNAYISPIGGLLTNEVIERTTKAWSQIDKDNCADK